MDDTMASEEQEGKCSSQKGVRAQMDDAMASDEQEGKLYSQKVRNLHNKMVKVLGDDIAPMDGMRDTWDNLLQLFSNNAPLTTKQIHSIKKIGDLVDLLMLEKYISFEDYEPFADKLETVHKAMASLVRGYSDKIKKQLAEDNGRAEKKDKLKRKLSKAAPASELASHTSKDN